MEEIKIGVVGCGAIGRDHIRRINEVIQRAHVVAVSDVNIEVGKKLQSDGMHNSFQMGKK